MCWAATLNSSITEDAGISQGQRHHGRLQIFLIAVLMQAHFRGRPVIVDQTGLRLTRIAPELRPSLEQQFRNWRPGTPSERVSCLIAIAPDIGHPTQPAAIRHPHREWRARARHSWREKRRLPDDVAQRGDQLLLRDPVQIARVEFRGRPAGRRGCRIVRQLGNTRIFVKTCLAGQPCPPICAMAPQGLRCHEIHK